MKRCSHLYLMTYARGAKNPVSASRFLGLMHPVTVVEVFKETGFFCVKGHGIAVSLPLLL